MTETPTPPHHDTDSTEHDLVLSSLELDQLAEAKRQRLPRRKLGRGELFVMMSLRLYLFFMVIVVIYQIVHGIR